MNLIKSTFFLLIFASYNLFSENLTNDSNNDSEKKFEFILKQNYTLYNPSEFDYITKDKRGLASYSDLKSNRFTYNPFTFIYNGNKVKIEANYSKFSKTGMNYDSSYIYNDSFYVYKSFLPIILRQDIELNFIKKDINSHNKLFKYNFGAGFRNIEKINERYAYLGFSHEKLSTNGIQLAFRSTFSFYKYLNFNMNFNIYKTIGKRIYNEQTAATYMNSSNQVFTQFTYVHPKSNTTGYISGREADFSFSYKFHENFKIYIGYNYNFAVFRYRNLEDNNIYYNQQFNSYYVYNKTWMASNELIRSVYLGISFNF